MLKNEVLRTLGYFSLFRQDNNDECFEFKETIYITYLVQRL